MPFDSADAADTAVESQTRRTLLRGFAAVGATGLGALLAPTTYANELRVGAAAPAAVLLTLDGERIATSDLLGRVVMLTFWATWCGPCRAELPLLSSYAQQHADAGLSILGFTLDSPDQLPKVRAVAQTLSFPVGFVAKSNLPGYGRIWRIPVNFTIDRAGRLIDDGWKDKEATWTQGRLDQIITPLLAPSHIPSPH